MKKLISAMAVFFALFIAFSPVVGAYGEAINPETKTLNNDSSASSPNYQESTDLGNNAWKFEGLELSSYSGIAGEKLYISTKVSGAVEKLQYKFSYIYNNQKDNENIISDFSNNRNLSFTPQKTGVYTIVCYVKDELNNQETQKSTYEATTDWLIEDINTGDNLDLEVEKAIVLSAKVKNAKPGLEYKFSYQYQDKSESPKLLSDFSIENKAKFIPEISGEYKVYAEVRDMYGNTKLFEKKLNVRDKVSAANSISLSHRSGSVNAGKTFFLKATINPSSEKVYWDSSDTSVATVSDGLVYGVSPGTATITARDAEKSRFAEFKVSVTEAQSIKFSYSSPNCAAYGSKLTLVAITDKSRDAVKFVVGNDTVNASEKQEDGNTYIWKASINATSVGKTTVKAYSHKGGVWDTCSDGDFTTFVTNSTDTTTPKLEARRASDEIINFIATSEGFINHLYYDIGGIATIGYGKVIYPGNTFYNNMTKTEGYALLLKAVNEGAYTVTVNNFLLNNSVKYNQRQFDALVSFSYNVGTAWTNSGYDLNRIILNAYESNDPEENYGTGTVVNIDSGSYLNVRSGPGSNYSVIATLTNGSKVTVLSKTGSWYKIRTSSGVEGYCSADFISLSDNPQPNPDINKTGTVVNIDSGSYLNVRSGPGSSYSVIATLTNGSKVTVLSKTGSWYKIRTSSGVEGYCSADFISLSENPQPGPDTSKTGTVVNIDSGSYLNVRSGPGSNYSVIATLTNGSKVTVLSKTGSWYKIRTSSGVEGYCSADFISLSENPQPSPDTNKTGTVVNIDSGSYLNVRSGPGSSYSVIATLTNGSKVTVLSKTGSWYKIRTSNGVEGYCSEAFISVDGGSGQSIGVVVNIDSGSYLNVRSGPGSGYSVIATLTNGSRVTILSKTGSWYKVRTSSGVEGYCSEAFISLGVSLEPSLLSSEVSDTAILTATAISNEQTAVSTETASAKSEPLAEKLSTSYTGSAIRSLDRVDFNEFALEFASWHHVGSACTLGLIYRRYDELNVFFYCEYSRHWSKESNAHNYPIPDCIKNIW